EEEEEYSTEDSEESTERRKLRHSKRRERKRRQRERAKRKQEREGSDEDSCADSSDLVDYAERKVEEEPEETVVKRTIGDLVTDMLDIMEERQGIKENETEKQPVGITETQGTSDIEKAEFLKSQKAISTIVNDLFDDLF
ncbi:hypothetical protein ADUPG1_007840, partial [Aduncisulcus paluster]